MHLILILMVQIKFYKSKDVHTIVSFKISNDVVVCILLDLKNKILTIKINEIERILIVNTFNYLILLRQITSS